MRSLRFWLGAILLSGVLSVSALEADFAIHWNGVSRGFIGLTNNASVSMPPAAVGTYNGWNENDSDLTGIRISITARTNTMTFPMTVTVGGNPVTGDGTNWLKVDWSDRPDNAEEFLRFEFPGGYSNPTYTNVAVAGFVLFDWSPVLHSSTDIQWVRNTAGGAASVFNMWGDNVKNYFRSHGTHAGGSSYGDVVEVSMLKLYYYTKLHIQPNGTNTVVRLYDPANNYALVGETKSEVGRPTDVWDLSFTAAYLEADLGAKPRGVYWGPLFGIYNPTLAEVASLVPGGDTYGLSQAEVQALINNANDGETITLPAGGATWSTNATINQKFLTIVGTSPGTWITNTQNGNIGSGTNLDGSVSFYIKPTTNGVLTIKNINFIDRSTNEPNFIYVGGGNKWGSVNIQNCVFYNSGHGAINVGDMVSGLVKGNVFIDPRSSINTYAQARMNESWVDALTLGTTNTFDVESNYVHYSTKMANRPLSSVGDTNKLTAIGITSQGLGGRAMWRFNTVSNLSGLWARFFDAHGNQYPVDTSIQPATSGITNAHRGTRQAEIYGNTIVNVARLSDFRGGTLIVNSNTFIGSGIDTAFYSREEDAPYSRNYRSSYPGYDQHWIWAWENTANGTNISSLTFANAQDGDFLIENTNVFFSAKGDWTALSYPHPLAAEAVAKQAVSLTGRVKLTNRVKIGR